MKPFDFNGDGKVDAIEQAIAYDIYKSYTNADEEDEAYKSSGGLDAMSDFDADGVFIGAGSSDGSYYNPQSNFDYTKTNNNIVDQAFMKLQNDAEQSPVPPEQAGTALVGSIIVILMCIGAVVLSVIVHNEAFTVIALIGTPFLACAIFNMMQKTQ